MASIEPTCMIENFAKYFNNKEYSDITFETKGNAQLFVTIN